MNTLKHGDCLEVMREMADASVDAIVTDPPAGIAFMGKSWDNPKNYPISGYGFSDGGKRLIGPTIGRSSRNGTCRNCGKRERGWKDVEPCRCEAPAFDEADRAKRDRDFFIAFLTDAMAECLRVAKPGSRALIWAIPRTSHWTGTAIEDAGWIIEDRISHLFGQGFPKAKSRLKPACEDWWLARKPFRTVPPLNIEDCRIGTGEGGTREGETTKDARYTTDGACNFAMKPGPRGGDAKGRWPANLVLDETAAAMLDLQTGTLKSGKAGPDGHKRNQPDRDQGIYGGGKGLWTEAGPAGSLIGDSGGASRFFYCGKASREDRGEGNDHPTVKPHDLMRWLIRLISGPGDLILDPFMGSGSTGKAAIVEGRDFIGIEAEEHNFRIAERRISEVEAEMPLFCAPKPRSVAGSQ